MVGLIPLLIAAPAWARAPGDYGAPTRQCTITDPEIDELSGLVVLPSGEMLLVEDGTPEPNPGATSILLYRIDAGCEVQGGAAEFFQDPRDIEDLAFQDDALWFADIGDNGETRDNVAVIRVAYDPLDPQPRAAEPEVFRLTYPDGPHDAEALLLAPDGTPYLVTKDPLGRSGVYRPSDQLDPSAEVAMEKVADLEFSMTGTTGGPVGRAGQLLVTGGAVSADGSRLALRTYTDAYVWALSGNDIAGALAADPLDVLALPDAPQGEAISFAGDSRSLVVGSEGVDSVITVIPAVADESAPSTATTGSPTGPAAASEGGADSGVETGAGNGFATTPLTIAAVLVVGSVVVAVAAWPGRRRQPRGDDSRQ